MILQITYKSRLQTTTYPLLSAGLITVSVRFFKLLTLLRPGGGGAQSVRGKLKMLYLRENT